MKKFLSFLFGAVAGGVGTYFYLKRRSRKQTKQLIDDLKDIISNANKRRKEVHRWEDVICILTLMNNNDVVHDQIVADFSKYEDKKIISLTHYLPEEDIIQRTKEEFGDDWKSAIEEVYSPLILGHVDVIQYDDGMYWWEFRNDE